MLDTKKHNCRLPESWMKYTLNDIESMIRNLPVPITDKIRKEDRINSDRIKLPLFTSVFDNLCSLLGCFPSQDLYAGYYLAQLNDEQLDFFGAEIFKRARRNALTLIREYHFYFLLKENTNYRIIFSYEYDQKGVDFVIENEYGQKYGLQLVTLTNNNGKLAKKYNMFKKLDFPVILLPISRATAQKINGYWLYGEDSLDVIRGGINNGV